MYPFNGVSIPITSTDYIMEFFDDLEKIIEKFEKFRNLCDEFEDFNDPSIEIAARKYVEVKNKLKELCEYHPIEKKDEDESEDDDEMEDEGEGNDESGVSDDSDDNGMHQKVAEDVEGSDDDDDEDEDEDEDDDEDDEEKCSGCNKCCLDNLLSPFKDFVALSKKLKKIITEEEDEYEESSKCFERKVKQEEIDEMNNMIKDILRQYKDIKYKVFANCSSKCIKMIVLLIQTYKGKSLRENLKGYYEIISTKNSLHEKREVMMQPENAKVIINFLEHVSKNCNDFLQ